MDLKQIKAVFPAAQDAWLIEILAQAPKAGIDTPNELASFLAEFGHETRGFTKFVESLYYNEDRLIKVWPRRFPTFQDATRYARNPPVLAEKVYGMRKDLGNTQHGDGWKYRGRGPQLTGRANYLKAGAALGLDLVNNPDLVLSPRIGVMVAIWFWGVKKLDTVDDDEDVRAETLAYNGGEVGLKERQDLMNKLVDAFA